MLVLLVDEIADDSIVAEVTAEDEMIGANGSYPNAYTIIILIWLYYHIQDNNT